MNKVHICALLVLGFGIAQAQTAKYTIKNGKNIEEIQLFGTSKKQQKGLEIITRLPLQPRDQIQSISIISDKAISEMGALTITDAAKNIPGVVLFSTYGGGAESMSIRGYRGTPVLKNGVLMNSDFRTSSMLTDMQGVESIQVIRGSAAITQGIGSALGAAGGVINLVTKAPRFYNASNIGFRYGSWEMYRPTVDIQRVLDANEKVAIRFNAAYQNNHSFADFVKGERIYINPSVAFRPDDKTNIVVQMDYLDDVRTPNRGTVNLADDDTYAIYDLSKNKFLGFATDEAKVKSMNFYTAIDRKLGDFLKVRAAYMASDNYSNSHASGRLAPVKGQAYNLRQRSVSISDGSDHSKVFQVDLIGQDIQTGILKHTFQLGFDWKESYTTSKQYSTNNNPRNNFINVDIIDVTQAVNNHLPQNFDWSQLKQIGETSSPKSPIIGATAQEVMHIGKYVKAIMGIRYSQYLGNNQSGQKHAWDPSLGLMLSPMENINFYASYTTITSLRGNDRLLENGSTVGASTTQQWEGGFKSDWLDEKLRFNLNLYYMKMDNLSYNVVDNSGNPIKNLYALAGNLTRKGVEIDLIGKVLPELEVMAGYAYLDAQYHDSPAYVNGSRPMMAAKHTANGWLNYTVREGVLRGLNFGGGVYYVGERPVNEYTQKPIIHNTVPDKEPFMLKAYTTLNAQIGYTYKNMGIKIFANNLTDAIGYNAYYRGGYINRNDPRNFAVQLNYQF